MTDRTKALDALDKLYAEFTHKDKRHTRKPSAADKINYDKIRKSLTEPSVTWDELYQIMRTTSANGSTKSLLEHWLYRNDPRKAGDSKPNEPVIPDAALREAVEAAEAALLAKHRSPVAGLAVLGKETLQTLITHALKGQSK